MRGKPPYQFIDDQLGSISILDIGRMHHHRQQQPHGIYNDVSLSTVDLLASVIATGAPFFRRLNRLTVYDGRARCWVPPLGLPDLDSESVIGSFPCTILSPFPKIPPHGAPRREVMRHGSPRAAVAQNVHNAVDDLP